MNRGFLGEFEELVLTIVALLKDQAYGNAILDEIKFHQDRTVNLSAIHVTLYRLEDKGLVRSHMAGATSKRGGRRKRYFEITSNGVVVLQQMKENRVRLWKLIPQLQTIGI